MEVLDGVHSLNFPSLIARWPRSHLPHDNNVDPYIVLLANLPHLDQALFLHLKRARHEDDDPLPPVLVPPVLEGEESHTNALDNVAVPELLEAVHAPEDPTEVVRGTSKELSTTTHT